MTTVEQQLSIDEIAELLGVDYSTVWRWIKQQKLTPVRKLGAGTVRIPASAVNRFLEARTVVHANGEVLKRTRTGGQR